VSSEPRRGVGPTGRGLSPGVGRAWPCPCCPCCCCWCCVCHGPWRCWGSQLPGPSSLTGEWAGGVGGCGEAGQAAGGRALGAPGSGPGSEAGDGGVWSKCRGQPRGAAAQGRAGGPCAPLPWRLSRPPGVGPARRGGRRRRRWAAGAGRPARGERRLLLLLLPRG